MAITKNTYLRPISPRFKPKEAWDSPAHVGRLKFGIDFQVPEGTPIRAALDGLVVDVKQDSDVGGPDESFDKYGNYIEIRHEKDEYSIYEHIKQNGSLVKVGDNVKRGDVIGYTGATGWLAHLGPHLHFDVHKYIEPFNPKRPDDYNTLEIRWSPSK